MRWYQTFMSPVNYRNPAHSLVRGQKAALEPLKGNDGKQICWLDDILELESRGLSFPDDLCSGASKRGNSLLMLLSGPTGTAKSTFALELCCRMAQAGRDGRGPVVNSFYVSAEETTGRLITKSREFGWSSDKNNKDKITWNYNELPEKIPVSSVFIHGKENFISEGSISESWSEDQFVKIADTWTIIANKCAQALVATPAYLEIIVVDSLNILSPLSGEQQRLNVFNTIQQKICIPGRDRRNPAVVIIVLDAAAQDEHSQYWEYVSDIVIRFDWSEQMDYTLRTFEIIKMRDQKHAWGKQRLKIYKGPENQEKSKYSWPNESPYLKEGGIFIFPSVHWHLSVLRHKKANKGPGDIKTEWLSVPEDVGNLNYQLGKGKKYQGFPFPGCTALVGPRGTMKSYLAYMFLLDQARKGKNSLLISLRDDFSAAMVSLGEIARKQGWPQKGEIFINNLINKDFLEIIYNEVGYISPEEFFHKIYVAMERPRKNGKRADIVVVNGLDQLEPRFPLISEETMFVPALIEILKSSGLCTVIVSAVGESTPPAGQSLYGLMPMADLLLGFERIDSKHIPVNYRWPDDFPKEIRESSQISQVDIIRVPAGEVGGNIGYLYRLPRETKVGYVPQLPIFPK